MKDLNDFPDLGKTFKKLRIAIDLEDLQGDSIFIEAVKIGIRDNPLPETLKMIISQYNDNPALVAKIIGWDLMQRIIDVMDDNPDDLRFVNI